jgi:hypothetical protein
MSPDLVQLAQNILALFAHDGEALVDEPWARDEVMFEEHFSASYEEFATKVTLLGSDQHVRYVATLKVNPEAAIVWVLAMNEV